MANKKYRSDASVNWDIFRSNFKKLLDSRGLTPTEFARTVDMSPGTVCRWLYERTPEILAALIIADYFNVSLDWLIGRTDFQFREIPIEARTVADRYLAASDSDKLIIDTLLSKYE